MSSEKPLCKYGKSCYRKNAAHLAQFRHPWKEERKEDKVQPLDAKNPSDDGASIMHQLVIGCNPVWSYRNSGKASYFSVANELHMDEDMYERAGNGHVFLLSETPAWHLKEQLRHGDVVDFAQYRGCGAFVAEPTDASMSDFYLWKTLEEMGYGVPPCFSDSPPGYYDNTELFYIFRDHHLIADPNHEIFAEIAKVKSGQQGNLPDWHTPVDAKTKGFPENYVLFQDRLNGGVGWLSFSSFQGQDFFHTKYVSLLLLLLSFSNESHHHPPD